MNVYQLLFCLLLVVILAFIKFSLSKKRKLKRQKQSLLNVKEIKVLIYYAQQHRGMVSAYLNGDKAAFDKITVLRKKIARTLRKIELQVSNENERLQSFVEHWQRLGNREITLSTESSFSQHTALIKNLLYLVEDEAERGLLFSQFLPQYPKVGYVWREVLCSTEIIGQIRAIGVGVATRKICSSTDKIRLSFLKQQINDVIASVLNELHCLPKFADEHNRLIRIAKKQTNSLIDTLEIELLSSNQITIDRQNYFDQASSVIQAIDNVFEHQLTQISNALN